MFTLLFTAFTLTAHIPANGLPVVKPRTVGMSAARLETVDRVVARGIRAGGFPGAAVVIGRNGSAAWKRGFGALDWDGRQKVDPDRTIYDLASLTKVVGTTTALMVLFDEGKLNLDAPVRTYLPAFQGGLKDSVTVRMLLEHRSGLPPGEDLWRDAHNPQEARLMVIDAPLVARPGERFIYSDLGADLLGMIVESISHEGLDQFLTERVFQPLGMFDTSFRPADSLKYRIAPTEVSPPRGYPLQGEVHDENAYALGGVAGHAGLFSTAADLSIFAQMMLNGGTYGGVRIVQDSTIKLFTTRAAGSRALGWDTAEGGVGSGEYLSDNAYGHTGFTGTSIWIDPDRQMFVVLLTNRVHEARARRPAKVISDVRNDLADAAALAVIDSPDGVLAMPASFRSDRAEGWNHVARHHSSRSVAARRARARAAAHAHHSSASTSKKPSKKASATKATPAKKSAARSHH